MTIRRPINDLPTSGWAPDAELRFAHLLAEKWATTSDQNKPHAIEGSRFRHSDAGGCSRKLAYKAAGIESTDPMDLTGVWNTSLGTLIHDAWQGALQERYPDATVETKVGEGEMSGHIDAVITNFIGPTEDDRTTCSYELKSVGGYKFKAAVGKIRRGTPPEGPSMEHIVQASLNGLAVDADEVVIGYLAKETLSKTYAEVPEAQRFCAEWTLTREQYEPLARLEIERVGGILSLLDDEGLLAARKVPGTPGEIIDPNTSRWEVRDDEGRMLDTGTVWNGSYCQYCAFQTLCLATEPGRIPVETAVELRKGM